MYVHRHLLSWPIVVEILVEHTRHVRHGHHYAGGTESMARRIPAAIPELGGRSRARTDTLTVGAKKALGNMLEEYGDAKGIQVFLDKAREQGSGNTLRQRVNSTYKTGAKLGQRANR